MLITQRLARIENRGRMSANLLGEKGGGREGEKGERGRFRSGRRMEDLEL